MKEVILDTNVFILYIVGQINPARISKHKRTSIYTKEHYAHLLSVVQGYDRLLICPNIATEVDNLLNNFSGEDRNTYLSVSRQVFKASAEKYIETAAASDTYFYPEVGLTDAAVLSMARQCDLLISGDSRLCDHARSVNIPLFDFKAYVNETSYR